MADEFRLVIDSLGNMSVSYLGALAESVRISWNPALASAQLTVHLRDDSWDSRQEAMKRLEPVREMFIDELALDFCFDSCEGGGCQEEADQETRDFVAA